MMTSAVPRSSHSYEESRRVRHQSEYIYRGDVVPIGEDTG